MQALRLLSGVQASTAPCTEDKGGLRDSAQCDSGARPRAQCTECGGSGHKARTEDKARREDRPLVPCSGATMTRKQNCLDR